MFAMSDIRESVEWIGCAITEMREDVAAIRDDMMVMRAVLNRVDARTTNLLQELRATRRQHDRMRARLDALTKAETGGPG
jgi:t-SNARE complex subunit (syntaxin)